MCGAVERGVLRYLREKIMKYICTMILAGTLGAGLTFAQESAKQDMKDAGSDVTGAAKKTGKGIKKGTKKGVHKAAGKTAEGADKVKDKTQ